MVAFIGAHTLTLKEFRACGGPEYFGEKDLIASRRWLVDVANALCTSICPDGEKVRIASCLLKDTGRDWWEEVGRTVGDATVDLMTWDDFVMIF